GQHLPHRSISLQRRGEGARVTIRLCHRSGTQTSTGWVDLQGLRGITVWPKDLERMETRWLRLGCLRRNGRPGRAEGLELGGALRRPDRDHAVAGLELEPRTRPVDPPAA